MSKCCDAPDSDALLDLRTLDVDFINGLLCSLLKEIDVQTTIDTGNSNTESISSSLNKHQYSRWTTYSNKHGENLSLRLLYPGGIQAAKDFFTDKHNRLVSSAELLNGQPQAIRDDCSSNLVCFMSRKKSLNARSSEYDKVVTDCWAADACIVENLNPDVIIAYATGEIEV